MADFNKVDNIADQIIVKFRVQVVKHVDGDFVVTGVGCQINFELADILGFIFCGLKGVSEVRGGPVVNCMRAGPSDHFLQSLQGESVHDRYLAGGRHSMEEVVRFYHQEVTDVVARQRLVEEFLLHVVFQFNNVTICHINGVEG